MKIKRDRHSYSLNIFDTYMFLEQTELNLKNHLLGSRALINVILSYFSCLLDRFLPASYLFRLYEHFSQKKKQRGVGFKIEKHLHKSRKLSSIEIWGT